MKGEKMVHKEVIKIGKIIKRSIQTRELKV